MDITDRLRVEDALRESEARFERIFRSAPGLMGITRRSDGRFLDVNDVFLRELGYTREDVIGRTVEELGLRADPSDRRRRWPPWPMQGVIHNLEVRLRRRSGGIFEGLVSVVPLTVAGEDCLLIHAVDTTARRRAEKSSRESQRMLATLMSNLPGMAYQCCDDPERTLLFVSEGCAELTGYPAFDLVGNRRLSFASLIHDEDREAVFAGLREAIAEGRPYRLTYRIHHASGQTRWVWEQGRVGAVVGRPAGHARRLRVGHHRPQTRRKRTCERSAEQLRQAQKMEAVGRLAGGIAHDFNNLLTAILGYSDLVLRKLAPADPLTGRVEEIRRAGERAASLTRKLLAFSRKQVLAPTVFDLDRVFEDLAPILRRLIGEDIDLRLQTGSAGHVKADPTQVEQVVMNLVVNARDAMPRGGTLAIETGRVELGAADAPAHGVPPGAYATFSVSDNGVGMDDATRARLFEPFFTTKGRGAGHRSRPLHRVRHRPAERGGHLGRQPGGRGHDVRRLPPERPGRGRRSGRRPGRRERTSRAGRRQRDHPGRRGRGSRAAAAARDPRAPRLLGHRGRERGGSADHLGRAGLAGGPRVTDVLMPRLDGPSFICQGERHPPRGAPGLPVGLRQRRHDAAPRNSIRPCRSCRSRSLPGALARTVRKVLDVQPASRPCD